MGEERETVLHVLDKERKLSEKQIHELVGQQESILKEREGRCNIVLSHCMYDVVKDS